MSDLRTPDQILADVGINVESFKKDKELHYSCIRRAMDEFAEQYHNWKQGKANEVNASDSGLHLQRVRRSYLGKGTGLKENDKYILNTTRARALLWLHPIVKHLVVKLEEWDEEEYYCGTVMFDKNRAIDIRNKLDELISAMAD